MADRIPTRRPVYDRPSSARIVGIVASLLAAYALWLTWDYIGLVSWVGEWQFDRFRVFFPILTILIVAAPFVLIALMVWIWRWLRRRRSQADVIEPEEVVLDSLISNATWTMRVLNVTAIIAVVTALLFAIQMWRLPRADAKPVTIDATSAGAPWEGPVKLVGQVDQRHVVLLSQRVLLTDTDLYIAPVIPPRGVPVRYFVEVVPIGRTLQGARSPMTGLLGSTVFPRETVALFRAHGVNVNRGENYVLYASPDSRRWRYIAAASQFVFLALLALVFAQLFRWRRRRLRERVLEIHEPGRLTRR